MGFAKDIAKVGTLGLAGLAFGHKKKPITPAAPQSSMISTAIPSRPNTSMIGPYRGDY